jgi:hypothetical protein
MKPGAVIGWSLLASGALAAGFFVYFFSSRSASPGASERDSPDDPSIVLSEPFRTVHGLKVENGSAYDKAALDISAYKKVVVPNDAEVKISKGEQRLQIFMKKTLSFAGHPPEPMSIRTARKNMGCAVKAEEESLVIATFGEWDSHIEGGTNMRIVLIVPDGKEVERRAQLSGPDSGGHKRHGQYLTKPKEVKEGYWYGPATPADGWRAVPDVADPERRAGN